MISMEDVCMCSYFSIFISCIKNFPILPAEDPEVFLLPPTIFQGHKDCDLSYTTSVDNELTIEEQRLFMDWQEQS